MVAFGLFSYDWEPEPVRQLERHGCKSWQHEREWTGLVDQGRVAGRPRPGPTGSRSRRTTSSSRYRVSSCRSQVPVPAQRQGLDQFHTIKAYDDHTLVYFHKKPLAINVWNLNFLIIPKHIYADSIADDPTLRTSDYHAEQERNPVFGGPYEIVRRQRGSEILLRRRESWYMHDGRAGARQAVLRPSAPPGDRGPQHPVVGV